MSVRKALKWIAFILMAIGLVVSLFQNDLSFLMLIFPVALILFATSITQLKASDKPAVNGESANEWVVTLGVIIVVILGIFGGLLVFAFAGSTIDNGTGKVIFGLGGLLFLAIIYLIFKRFTTHRSQ